MVDWHGPPSGGPLLGAVLQTCVSPPPLRGGFPSYHVFNVMKPEQSTPVLNNSTAMLALFNAARNQLTAGELEWLSKFDDLAISTIDVTVASIERLANDASKPGEDELACILDGFSEALRTASAQTYIASEARWLLKDSPAESS